MTKGSADRGWRQLLVSLQWLSRPLTGPFSPHDAPSIIDTDIYIGNLLTLQWLDSGVKIWRWVAR